MLVITTVAVITKATSAGLLDYLMEQKLQVDPSFSVL